MSEPKAVLISDVHYSVQTLKLADAALRQAITKANELQVPLIVAGDLHDSKANLRAECVNAMIETFKTASRKPLLLRGNHCSINEKSKVSALNFLDPYCHMVNDEMLIVEELELFCVPYEHDLEQLSRTLRWIPPTSEVIMHQGIQGSEAGHYIQDPTAIPQEWVKDFRVISGHYHRRQDIKTGRPQKGAVGFFSYIGNPYTLNFGEANDPEKGFQILMSDGTLEFVPTNLRKHVVHEASSTLELVACPKVNPDDLLWIKYKAPSDELAKITKEWVRKYAGLDAGFSFKLDLIPTDGIVTAKEEPKFKGMPEDQLDFILDNLDNVDKNKKERLKDLWKSLILRDGA